MLPDQEIEVRLNNLEDSLTERKTEGDRKDFLKTICGFANSVPEGQIGILFIGVKNDGTIQGLKGPESLQKTIREICEDKCYPKVTYQTRLMRKENTNYLAVLVPFSKDKPHFSGPAYVRKGSETGLASEEMFEELIYSRTSKGKRGVEKRGQSRNSGIIHLLVSFIKKLAVPTKYRMEHSAKRIATVTLTTFSFKVFSSSLNYR